MITKKLTTLLLLQLMLLSCTQNLPENYGVYAYTDKGRINLSGQKIYFTGNLLQSITGLKGAYGTECNSIKHLIVFEKNISPGTVKLSKLEFKRGGSVQNIIGQTYVNVNLWVVSNNVDFDIAPIEGKKDMYKFTPKTELSEGLYALHFGGLNNISTLEASVGNLAYDFVIGKADDYPSYEVIKKRNEEKMKAEAGNLLNLFNTYFNNRDFNKLKDIYKPNGRVFSDPEWHDFSKGLETWLNGAGKVIDSKIINSNIEDDVGTFEIRTSYEKKGTQKEKLIVQKLGQNYFITSID